MANRRFIQGFEHGTTGRNAPSDGNITVQSTIKRTGTYALHCNILSGTKSTLSLGHQLGSNDDTLSFSRFYIYITTLPSSDRSIISTGTSPGADTFELGINSTGHVIIRNNSVTKITSTNTLSTGAWHCIEFGLENQHYMTALQIDQVLDFDWTSWSSSTPGNNRSWADLVVGSIVSTGGSAMEYYLDDIAIDYYGWCGAGQVVGLNPIDVSDTDGNNTAWTNNGGASKAASITWPLDDDTSYIESNTTSGTSTSQLFDIEDVGGSTVIVRGSTAWVRSKRAVSGTGNQIVLRRKLYGIYENYTNGPDTTLGVTNTYTTTNVCTTSWSPLGWEMTVNEFNAIDWGFYNGDAAGYRVTSLMIEADITTDATAAYEPHRIFLASCDTGDLKEFGSSPSGTPTASTTHVRDGTYSIVTTASASSSCYLQQTSSNDTNSKAPFAVLYGKAHIYVSTLPSTGSVEILGLFSGSTRAFGVQLTSSGTLGINNWGTSVTTQAATSGTGITLNTWQCLEWYVVNEGTSPSSNGKMVIYLDGVALVTSSTLHGTGLAFSSNTYLWGVRANGSSTGSTTIYWDDIVLDWGSRIGNTSISTLYPTGIGKYAGIGWSANTGTVYGAVSEVGPNDGDTTYALSTVNNTAFPDQTNGISFVLPDLPSNALYVKCVETAYWTKQNAGGQVTSPHTGLVVNSSDSIRSSNGNIGGVIESSYTFHQFIMPFGPQGQFNVTQVNNMELLLWSEYIDAYRVTQAKALVEYVGTTADTKEVILNGKVASTGNHEVVLNGYVDPGVITRTKEVILNGKVAATSNHEATLHSMVQATNTHETTLNGLIAGTNTYQVITGGMVQKTSIYESSLTSMVQATETLETILNGVITSTNTYQAVLTGHIQTTGEYNVDLIGIIQDTNTHEVELDGYIISIDVSEVSLHGIVKGTNIYEVGLTGIIKGTDTYEVITNGIVQATNQYNIPLSGMVQKTNTYQATLGSIVTVTEDYEVDLAGVVQATDTLQVTLNGDILATEVFEVTQNGIVQVQDNAYEVNMPGYVGGIIGVLHADKFANRRINAIPFVLGTVPGGYINYVYPQSQIRTGLQGDSKRIALLDLSLDGYIVDGISEDSNISFTVYHEDKSQYRGTQKAIWNAVYVDTIFQNIYGWTALLDLPMVNETIMIVWTINIDGVKETLIDYIEVSS